MTVFHHQLFQVLVCILHQVPDDIGLQFAETTVSRTASIQEYAFYIRSLINLKATLQDIQNGIGCEIIIKVIDVIPHIDPADLLTP